MLTDVSQPTFLTKTTHKNNTILSSFNKNIIVIHEGHPKKHLKSNLRKRSHDAFEDLFC